MQERLWPRLPVKKIEYTGGGKDFGFVWTNVGQMKNPLYASLQELV